MSASAGSGTEEMFTLPPLSSARECPGCPPRPKMGKECKMPWDHKVIRLCLLDTLTGSHQTMVFSMCGQVQ